MRRAAYWILIVILTLASPLAVAFLVARYHLSIPYWDEWTMVPLMARAMHGPVTLGDLWTLHNEHRMLFSKAVFIALARATHWNIGAEMALTLIISACCAGGLAWVLSRQAREQGWPRPELAWPLCFMFLFSLKELENWLWGWQAALIMCNSACTAGFFLLVGRGRPGTWLNWTRLSLAAALGVFATYSFGAGMVFWPVALLGIAVAPLSPNAPPGRRAAMLCAWTVCSATILGIYFYHYHRPPLDAPHGYFITHFGDYLRFVLMMLGSPLAGGSAAAAAAVGILLAGMMFGEQLQRDGPWRGALLPWWLVTAFSVGNVLLIAAGRVSFGEAQARVTRYLVFTLPFWLALVVHAAALYSKANLNRPHAMAQRRLSAAVAIGVCVLIVHSSLRAIPYYREFYEQMSPSQDELFRLHDNAKLEVIYPNAQVVRDGAGLLNRERLAIFARQESPLPDR